MSWAHDPSTRRRLFVGVGLLVVWLASWVPHQDTVQGQKPKSRQGAVGQNLFQPASRRPRQWMRIARNLLEEKRYAEAIGFLQRILDHPDDFFQASRGGPTWTSFKREAQELIGRLPPEGREAYRLQFEASARRLLRRGLEQNRIELLEEASRRYFHTLSGYRATYLLGRWHLSRGQTLAALVQFLRLEQSPARQHFEPDLSLQLAACWARLGYRDRATAALKRLGQEYERVSVSAGGASVPLPPAPEELLARLVPKAAAYPAGVEHPEQWLMVRGNPARSAQASAGLPVSDVRWRIPLTTDPELLEKLDYPTYPSQERPLVPAVQPLVVKDQVLVRTAEGLVAVDFRTGKRIWQVAEETAQAVPGQEGPMEGLMVLPNGLVVAPRGSVSRADLLRRRLMQDLSYGTLSSDGHNVYLVQNLPLPVLPGSATTRIFLPNGRVATPSRYKHNVLQARSLAQEGKLIWEVGGPEGQDALPLAGTFFLGAPLPLDGTLFVIGEQKGEIRLYALEATTGRPLWSQQLVVVEQDLSLDVLRRMAGVSPTYADGVLICPTAAGAVVALDLPTRSLRWGFVYQRTSNLRRGPFFRPFPTPGRMREGDRWLEATPVVAGDLVLLTPPESNELVALDLLSGQLRWKVPRQDGLYIGGVSRESVLVVGAKSARVLQLRDGKSLHRFSYPEGRFPSGRGLLEQNRYLLPLSGGLLLVLDLSQGTVLQQHALRHGQELGNLVSYRGSLVSVGPAFVDCYYQRAWLQQWVQRRLQQDAQDAAALAWKGALLIDQGKLEQARELLSRAYRRQASPLARQLLLESSLKLLERDYHKFASLTEDIRRLIVFPEEQVRFLLTLASAYENVGQWEKAFDTYHRLARMGQGLDDLIPTADGTLVRQQRWLGWRLAAVYRQASPQQRTVLDKKIHEQLQQFLAQGDVKTLSRFLTLYSFHSTADQARDALLKWLRDQGASLQRELLLRQLARSQQPQVAAGALLELARLFDQAGRPLECAWQLRQLLTRYADVELEGGKTVAQLCQQFSLNPTAARVARGKLLQPVSWKSSVGTARPMTERYFAISVQVAPDTSPGMVLLFDQNRRTVIGLDGLGRTLWKVSLATRSTTGYVSSNIIRARAYGNLILFSMGYQVYAIDGITGNGRLLWKKDLRSQAEVRPFGIRTQMIGTPWGERFHYATDNLGRPVGLLGPVLPDQVHIQVGTELMALEPLTGKVIWKRDHIAPGSVLLGDEQTLVVIPPGGGSSLLLETATGKLIKRVQLPHRFQGIVAVCGARVVRWQYRSGKIHLEMFDPREEKTLWQREVPNGTKAVQFAPGLLALLSPKGELLVLKLPGGEALIEQKVDLLSPLLELHAVVQGEQILVVANSRTPANAEIGYVSPIPGGSRCLRLHGHIHCFSRDTGRHLWSTRVQHQGLMLDQPWAMPALVLASHIYRRLQGRGATYHAVSCIDRRTGKLIFEQEFDGSVSSFRAFGDPESGQVTITVSRRITLTPQPKGQDASADKKTPVVAPPARDK